MGTNFSTEKVRPGAYWRYENYGGPIEAGAADGVCAAVIKTTEASSATVETLESVKDIGKKYGTDGNAMLYEMFRGGAKKIYACSCDAYDNAFEALKPLRWNVIGIDTDDSVAQDALVTFVNEMYDDGKFVMGVVGDSASFASRAEPYQAFNDYKIIYVGSGFKYADKVNADKTAVEVKREGFLAAARVAGMIAGTPANASITHKVITGAVEVTEHLTNANYEAAIQNGMLTFSTAPNGTIWVESGVNTLVNLDTEDDAGWKKIKRTKIRFELMQRMNDTVENLVGSINNDADGRATIIQAAQGVCNSMVNEKKLLAGAKVVLDDANPPEGESAWFLIFADDIDSLEKMYFTFKFRFAPEAEAAPQEETATVED